TARPGRPAAGGGADDRAALAPGHGRGRRRRGCLRRGRVVTEMRLQRALARAGVASRRAAETLITDGKVRVDGKPATLGMKVDPATQRITVRGRPVRLKE